jgi:hypothetical protein
VGSEWAYDFFITSLEFKFVHGGERKAHVDGIHVLNPKEIYQVCASFPEKLAEPQIRRICHQLDQKCRIAVT